MNSDRPGGQVDETHARRLKQLGNLVGNTPLLEIELAFDGRPYTVFAKAENYSLTGSIKDRMALHIMRAAHASGAIHPGDAIAEATSGNTGIAFAAIGRALGHPVTIFMPDWMSEERKQLIASYGATTRLVTAEEGGFLGAIEMAEQMAARHPRHLPASAVQQRRQRRGARGHHRAGDLVAARGARQAARRIRCGRRHRRHRHGGEPRSSRAQARRARPPARAGELPHAAHRSPGGSPPHPGHKRRVHSPHRRPGLARRDRQRRRWRLDHHGAAPLGGAWTWSGHLERSEPARSRHACGRDGARGIGGHGLLGRQQEVPLDRPDGRGAESSRTTSHRGSSCAGFSRTSGCASCAAKARSASERSRASASRRARTACSGPRSPGASRRTASAS